MFDAFSSREPVPTSLENTMGFAALQKASTFADRALGSRQIW